jgi:hypothetical protein
MTDKPRPLDHVDADRAHLVADLREKDAIALKARSAASDARRRLEAHDLAKASTDGLTIETALVATVNGRDHTRGLKYLRERRAADWNNSFVRFPGGFWVSNDQHVVEVAVPGDATLAELAATEDALLEIIPFVQPGAIDQASRRHLHDMKIVKIVDDGLSEHASHILAFGDDHWFVLNARSTTFRPSIQGSLRDCLEFIRARLPFSLASRNKVPA